MMDGCYFTVNLMNLQQMFRSALSTIGSFVRKLPNQLNKEKIPRRQDRAYSCVKVATIMIMLCLLLGYKGCFKYIWSVSLKLTMQPQAVARSIEDKPSILCRFTHIHLDLDLNYIFISKVSRS